MWRSRAGRMLALRWCLACSRAACVLFDIRSRPKNFGHKKTPAFAGVQSVRDYFLLARSIAIIAKPWSWNAAILAASTSVAALFTRP